MPGLGKMGHRYAPCSLYKLDPATPEGMLTGKGWGGAGGRGSVSLVASLEAVRTVHERPNPPFCS